MGQTASCVKKVEVNNYEISNTVQRYFGSD